MRKLFPYNFAELGWAEFGWIFLAFGGLSLLAVGWQKRTIKALVFAVVVALFGWLRSGSEGIGEGPWNRWAPIWFSPLLAIAVVMLDRVRAPLVRAAGSGTRLGFAWTGALLVWTVALRPFDASFSAWVLTTTLLFALVCLLQPPECAPRSLLGRRGIAPGIAVVFLAFCYFANPAGVGVFGGVVMVLLVWLGYAVNEQGQAMRRYVMRRLLEAPFVIAVVVVLSFVIMRAAPGGPFDKEKPLPPEIKAALRAKYLLDEPLPVQIKAYLVDVGWSGDLGTSMKYVGKEVNEIIATHVKPSYQLGAAALALALIIGVGAGLIAGIKQNSLFDYFSMTAAMLGLALPTFVVGSFLVLLFSMRLDWFNVSGWDDFPRDLILPAVTLSLPFAARLARLTRAGMLEIVTQDYVRTARAKGLSEPMIVMRHTLKGTLLPVISFLGPAVAQLLTGSLVVEKIFGVPGLGTEFVQAALNRDYTVAMGLVVLFGVLLVVFNLIVDIAYGFLDPRIRHG